MAISLNIGTHWCHDFPKLARESGFYFNVHKPRGRIDWNRISLIDIERVIRERDFLIIDENINNVINYSLENEHDVNILDSNFVKLFRLAQLAVEYLLYCKQYLDHSVVILKDELRIKIEDNCKLKKEIATSEEIIKQLKEKTKDRNKVIETKIYDSQGEIHKCPHCPKTFVSSTFVSAHIARRHAYSTDVFFSSTPVPDQYRAETEKLHNEIKDLKERLNQTERIIRTETSIVPNNDVTYHKSNITKNEEKEIISHADKDRSIQQQHLMYQEEINSLKGLLFSEISNLKERDVSSTNLRDSIPMKNHHQEKEFQKLRNELLERLTPDIECMQVKLNAQEDYWRTKIEHMERQHRTDIERLTTELKATQEVAERMKTEYNYKVANLEEKSLSQSKILTQQSVQLSSLSHNIHTSQIQSQFKENSANLGMKSYVYDEIEQNSNSHNIEAHTVKRNKVITVGKNEQKSPQKPMLLTNVEKHSVFKNLKGEGITNNSPSVRNQYEILDKMKQHKTALKKAIEDISSVSSDRDSDSQDARAITNEQVKPSPVNRKPENHTTKALDASSVTNNTTRFVDSNLKKDLSKKTTSVDDIFNIPSSNSRAIKLNKEDRLFRDNKTEVDVEEISESETESSTSESTYDSTSQSLSDSNSVIEATKVTAALPKKGKDQQDNTMLEDIKKNLQEVFYKKLRDLGLDPEWQGIPKATFEQKMQIIRHHQNIHSKKLRKYDQLRSKIINDILRKVAAKQTMDTTKAVKTLSMKGQNDADTVRENSTVLSPLKRIVPSTVHRKHIKDKCTYNSDNIPTTKDAYDSSRDRQIFHEKIQHKIMPKSNVAETAVVENFESNESDVVGEQKGALRDTVLMSPKNKSVLKSTIGSTGSLIKKKVFFDLENKEPQANLKYSTSVGALFSTDKESRDSDDNISSISDENEHTLNKYKSMSTGNIILKTSQSDKIAEISKTIEEKLSISRQKPTGAVETVFLANYKQKGETSLSKENVDIGRTALVNPDKKFSGTAKTKSDKLSSPSFEQTTFNDTDLEEEINEILRLT